MKKNADDEINKFSFQPMVTESVFFKASGAFIESATISVGATLLSIFKPEYAPEYSLRDVEPPTIDLSFFGNAPFHGALSSGWETVNIAINTYDNKFPSLIMEVADKTLTWVDINDKIHEEKVTVGSNNGPRDLIMVYLPTQCGYKQI